jgi:hypothetical protein
MPIPSAPNKGIVTERIESRFLIVIGFGTYKKTLGRLSCIADCPERLPEVPYDGYRQ